MMSDQYTESTPLGLALALVEIASIARGLRGLGGVIRMVHKKDHGDG